MAVGSQIAIANVLADLNLAVQYGIAICVYVSKKFTQQKSVHVSTYNSSTFICILVNSSNFLRNTNACKDRVCPHCLQVWAEHVIYIY